MRGFFKQSPHRTLVISFIASVLLFLSGFSQAGAENIINAGNSGDYYHNSDELHTNLSNPATDHPGLTLIEPTRSAVTWVTEGKVVVGNASLAYYHPWGGDLVSIMRYWFTNSQYYANLAYTQYRSNNAYWYPEHRDHDARDNNHTQTATVTNSQGSSGSEMDEIKRFIWTLAAFKTFTKQKLIQNGLLMPTIQMIMRRTRVSSDEEYLSGKAHPNAFDNATNTLAMQEWAAGMDADKVPPMVQLEVLDDTYLGSVGKDIFQYSTVQRLYDTPVSISRIWKNRNYSNKILVSAENSFDVNGRTLSFHWAVLRGDPAHVRITPQNETGSVVEIAIDYHPETTIPGSERLTNLVSVGAFVHNGHYYSAPGFVTSYTLPTEVRVYDETKGRLLEMSYVVRPKLQLLPGIEGCLYGWSKDVFHYNGSGTLTGWSRYNGEAETKFTPEGYEVLSTDASGNPLSVQNVYYTTFYQDSMPYATWTKTGEPFNYEASGEDITAPSVPAALHASEIGASSFRLAWERSTDDIGVGGYVLDVAEDSAFVKKLSGYDQADLGNIATRYLLGLSHSTLYYARVRAYDAAGNLSGVSDSVSVLTLDGQSLDGDGDGVIDSADCAPGDGTKWRNKAYPDDDKDGVRESLDFVTVDCFGIAPPLGSVLGEMSLDNCPVNFNPDQIDTDDDGVGDVCEGDIPPDPEPRKDAYTLTGVWNTFNRQLNVIECVNESTVALDLSLDVEDYTGALRGEKEIRLLARGGSHTILNEFNLSDSYGTYSVEVLTETSSSRPLRCKTVFYRLAGAGDLRQVEYAYSIPAGVLLSGDSAGIYNSMNPELGNAQPVYNWLSVYNPGTLPFSATVQVLSQDGSLNQLASFRLEGLRPGERSDKALGHEQGQTTGLYRIIPDDKSQVYGAFLSRFSLSQDGTYDFGFTLLAAKAVSDSGFIPASSMGPAYNWAEIANVSGQVVSVLIEVINRERKVLLSASAELSPGEQHHLFLNEPLAEDKIGSFRVRVIKGGAPAGSIVVQSLFYGFREGLPQQMLWAYASQSRASAQRLESAVSLPINTFFGAANWLKLLNPENKSSRVGVSLYSLQGEEIASLFSSFSLSGAADLALHEAVGPDFAGVVFIESEVPVITENVRVIPSRMGDVGYITNVTP